MKTASHALPPDHADRVWWFWKRRWGLKKSRRKRRQFQGKNFYVACNKAAVHFGIDPQSIDGVLASRMEIDDESKRTTKAGRGSKKNGSPER